MRRECTKPPTRQSVTDWSEANLYLAKSAHPGPLQLRNRTPYLCEIVDSMNNSAVEEITFAKSTQVGGTTAFHCMIGYIIACDPQPTMLVMPNEKMSISTSKTRIKPLIDSSAVLSKHKPSNPDLYQNLEMMFDNMTLTIVGSNSPANLASRPICFLFLDETDKYKEQTDREASAPFLAIHRTRTYWNRKIVRTSTPTIPTGEIWQAFKLGDQRYFFVPCPNCNKEQRLQFASLQWPDECYTRDGLVNEDKVLTETYYQCKHCEFQVRDSHKQNMLLKGIWKPTAEQLTKRRRSYQVNSLYAPWTKFGEIAVKYLKAKQSDIGAETNAMQDFYNGELGEPWEDVRKVADVETISTRRAEYRVGELPYPPRKLVLTVDVQQNCMWYLLRAWCENNRSYYVTHGLFTDQGDEQGDFTQLRNYINNLKENGKECKSDGKAYRLTHCYIDSGYRTDTVFEFCRRNLCQPVKGFGNRQNANPFYFQQSSYGIPKITFDSDYFKTMLQLKYFTQDHEAGAWFLPANIHGNYFQQLTAETLINRVDTLNRVTSHWKEIRRENHLLDCEVIQLLASMTFGEDALIGEKPQLNVIGGVGREDGRQYLDVG